MKLHHFQIEFFNLPEDKILTIDDQPELNIIVNTYGFNLFGSYFYDKTIAIDFTNDVYVDKDNYVWIANRALPNIENQFGQSFKIESIQPDTLYFSFGTLSVKKVPITLNSNVT